MSKYQEVDRVKRGAWTAVIIDRNAEGTNHGVSEELRYMLKLEHPDGFRTSWPVKYDDGTIAYDMPVVPRDAKRATEASFKRIDELIERKKKQ